MLLGKEKKGQTQTRVVWRGKNPNPPGSLLSPYFIVSRWSGAFSKTVKTLPDNPGASGYFYFRGKMLEIFADAFLWSNQQSSPFNDTYRVEKAKLAMHF